MNWLKQGHEKYDKPDKSDALLAEKQREDALNVLGLAGLASQKLLLKHKLIRLGKDKKHFLGELEPRNAVPDAMKAFKVESNFHSGIFPFISVLRRKEVQCRSFFRYQVRRAQDFV